MKVSAERILPGGHGTLSSLLVDELGMFATYEQARQVNVLLRSVLVGKGESTRMGREEEMEAWRL